MKLENKKFLVACLFLWRLWKSLTPRALIFASIWVGLMAIPMFVQEAVPSDERTVTPPDQFFLTEDVALGFVPSRAFFLVRSTNNVYRRYAAVIQPYLSKTQGTNGGIQRWLFGIPIESADVGESFEYSLVATGEMGRTFFQPPRRVSPNDPQFFSGSQEVLSKHLGERKALLADWHGQIREQEAILNRLRADADVIANLGRIVDVKEEIDRGNAIEKDLEKDIENIQKFLKLVKSREDPKNFAGREGQLTKQIAELAEVAREAEGSEKKRRSKGDDEAKSRAQIIELGKTEDYEALQRELIRLRKKRIDQNKSEGQTTSGVGEVM